MISLLVIVIALALIFDYINGFHDAANSIATVVSTKVLTPFQAVLWAAFFNVVAYFIFKDHAVANTIGKTVYKDFITLPVIFSGLIAAIIWNLLTWWYGIPSSSSHTLIGGFAGSAICAALLQDPSLDIAQIIDSGKVGKTVLFIFLAPIVGMAIAMFFTLVLIQRNTWLKCTILALLGVGIWFSFQKFQNDKIVEKTAKFYTIEKNEKLVADKEMTLAHTTEPQKREQINQKIADAKNHIAKGQANLELSKPFLKEYDTKGAEWVVSSILANANIDLSEVEVSRYKDKISSYFELEKLKINAQKDTTDKVRAEKYIYTKALVDSIKPLAALYTTVGFDSMVNAMVLKGHMNPIDASRFKRGIEMNIAKDLVKEIENADNRLLRYFLIGALLIFIASFIYTEKIKEPTAQRTSNLFKRLQLLSSAGFSIGHGGNDAQKVMGIIAAAMVANGDFNDISTAMSENWIPIACYLAIGLGTLSGGWKIVKTMGGKITKVTPLEGVGAETAGATTLFLTEQMGIPVSTTHTITGSIIGVGATKRLSAVRWGVTINLLWAWILTIPVSALIAAIVYYIVSIFL